MKQDDMPDSFTKTGPMYCVIDMRSGELICNLEAADATEAVYRAASVASLLGRLVATTDLAAAPVEEAVPMVPTFMGAFFLQEGLFGAAPAGTKLQ